MNSTINFNSSFGDIKILEGDLDMLRSTTKTNLQMIINYFKTNSGDYRLTPDFGFDSDRYIGEAVTEALAMNIAQKIREDLVDLQIITNQYDIEILHMIKEHTIFFRIIFGDNEGLTFEFLKDEGFKLENE